ncbi:uncharacterized protein LOC130737041 [Lotus japonicus]|uniref:uncharacterized protein LOC130737041 n=1 Tax=Lotus japonicus TaxID=34305 RepID=UPI0025887474|nr:uncharacterized protein LOC130737041 [Lotus japonicus]
MIPTKKKNRIKRSLYSIPGNRVYPFQFSMLYNKKFCGFSHGWLATLGGVEDIITLTNPLKNVAPIVLPRLYFHYYGRHRRSYVYVNKVVLSVDPLMNPNDYVVAAIHSHSFSFIKAGKNYWINVEVENYYHFRYADITFYQGLVYVVCGRRNVLPGVVVDFDRIMSFNLYCLDDDPCRRVKIIPNIFHQDSERGFYSMRAYLVKSLEGDLWMVRRILPSQFNNCKDDGNVVFNVYKLELDDAQNGKVLQMLKLENLGDNVLFVGDYSDSTVASNPYFSNSLQKDSIYYTNDNDVGSPIPPSHDPLDLRVYNVKEGRVFQNYPFNPSFTRVSPSLWILPPFQWD